MIYHFKIHSQESIDFQLEIQLSEKHTFYDFHRAIQNNTGFESHQLASFFVSDKKWKKLSEISLLDLINSKEQKLIYTFDFFNDRSFFIELTGIIMEQNLSEPLVTLKTGKSPVQILGEDANEREPVMNHEEEVFMDFGELEDYTEIFGEMDDF
jgi:hypothetical protein